LARLGLRLAALPVALLGLLRVARSHRRVVRR
jgi:hypothetical protein